jgi:hypothetical protein
MTTDDQAFPYCQREIDTVSISLTDNQYLIVQPVTVIVNDTTIQRVVYCFDVGREVLWCSQAGQSM